MAQGCAKAGMQRGAGGPGAGGAAEQGRARRWALRRSAGGGVPPKGDHARIRRPDCRLHRKNMGGRCASTCASLPLTVVHCTELACYQCRVDRRYVF